MHDTGLIGMHGGVDVRYGMYLCTDGRDVIAIKPKFLASMGLNYGAPHAHAKAPLRF